MAYITIRKTTAVGPSLISIKKSSAIGTRITSVPRTVLVGVSARYWRLRMTATNTDDAGDTYWLEIASAELRTSVGGTNVALSTNTPAVTATGTNTQVGAPSNAIDGNNSTYWQAEDGTAISGGTSDLDIDLKSNYNITEVAIRNGTFSAVRAPTTVAIYTSPDNSTWTLINTWTPAAWTSAGQTQTYTFP